MLKKCMNCHGMAKSALCPTCAEDPAVVCHTIMELLRPGVAYVAVSTDGMWAVPVDQPKAGGVITVCGQQFQVMEVKRGGRVVLKAVR